MQWTYYPRESLAPYQRRRQPIGRQLVEPNDLVWLLETIMQSPLPTDILLIIANNELAWITDGRVKTIDWLGVKLSNGSGYLMPGLLEPIRAHRSDRHFDEQISPDGAGLCVTILTMQAVQNREDPFPKDRRQAFKRLFAFVEQHPDCRAIRAVLD